MTDTDAAVHPRDQDVELDAETKALASPPLPAAISTIPGGAEFDRMMKVADAIAMSSLVPNAYRGRPADVAVCLLHARELGIGPMYALQKIHVVDGKPGQAAELMATLIRRAGHDFRTIEASDTRAVVWGRRRDSGAEMTVEFTIAQARRVRTKIERDKWGSLTEKGVWQSYPEDMLWSRATSRLGRRHFSDVLAGMGYTPEELESIGDGSDPDEAFDKARMEWANRPPTALTPASPTTDNDQNLNGGPTPLSHDHPERRLSQPERDDLKRLCGAVSGQPQSFGYFTGLVASAFTEIDNWKPEIKNGRPVPPAFGDIRVKHATWIRERVAEDQGQDPDQVDPDQPNGAGDGTLPGLTPT
jgi:hypothetical protein